MKRACSYFSSKCKADGEVVDSRPTECMSKGEKKKSIPLPPELKYDALGTLITQFISSFPIVTNTCTTTNSCYFFFLVNPIAVIMVVVGSGFWKRIYHCVMHNCFEV